MPQAATPTQTANPGLVALRRFAISITAFTVVGHLFLGFEQAYLTPVVALLTAYTASIALETLDAWARGRPARFTGSFVNLVNFLLPAHIAALACAMLLYGNERLLPTVFAVTVAIASKYAVRIRVDGVLRHLFNPSNLGISATLVCFQWVAIAPPYQFTENGGPIVDLLVPAFILVSGTMLNAKLTGRTPLIAGWVGGFVLQAVLRAAYFGDALLPALLTTTGVAFILFTNYMITDPVTTPTRPQNQAVFGLATALVYGALVVAHVTFGLFYALTIVCAGHTVLLWAHERWPSRRTAPVGEPTRQAPVPDRDATPVAAFPASRTV